MKTFKRFAILIATISIIALPIAIFVSGWAAQGICRELLYLEQPPRFGKNISVLMIRFMCLETTRWMETAKLGSPKELAICNDGQRKVIAPESPWYGSLVAYTNRLRTEYTERGESPCLGEEEILSLKENEIVVEMLFTSPPSAYRQGMLLPLTGQYRGWVLHFPGWRRKTEACGVKVDDEMVMGELERLIDLMLEAQTQ
jgi:hypothetical protein